MLLAIEAGNTNVMFAVFDGEDVVAQWRSHTNAPRTADEHAVWLSQLMTLKGLKISDIDAAIISTVVPQALFDFRVLCHRYFECEPIIVGEGADLGIKILIDRPQDVGADRLVNTVAAHAIYGGPLVVIDFGTATNFDIVDKDGNFVGGVLAPGVNLSLEALHSFTAKLPRVDVRRTQKVIGKDTVSAMQSGAFWGTVGLIEGLIGRIKEEIGSEMKVIATGGLAALFREAIPVIDHVDQELTIRGLLEIYRRNQA